MRIDTKQLVHSFFCHRHIVNYFLVLWMFVRILWWCQFAFGQYDGEHPFHYQWKGHCWVFFQVRRTVKERPQEKSHLISHWGVKISGCLLYPADCIESFKMGTSHLQPKMGEATFCAKSQLELNFPLPSNILPGFSQISRSFVQLCSSSAVTQMWSRLPADFPRQQLSSHACASPASLVTSLPMPAPRAPTRSHAPFETAHDWASFVGGPCKKIVSGGILAKPWGGVCSAAPDRLGNFRPVVE